MKVRYVCLAFAALVLCPAVALAQPGNFPTSLHATRAGKDYWYGAANGGFEAFTNVPIEDLGCVECHGPTNANGEPYTGTYTPSCVDCHDSAMNVEQSQCLGCHGRQKTEINLGFSDVHRDAGMLCWDCHTTGDLHGDGTMYNSMLEPGAVDVDCTGCHPTLPPAHGGYDPHAGALHCTACHTQTVISCYNCHFESQVQAHVKRAKQPLNEFVMLANRDKDGKVYPLTFQSLTYQGDAFAAFGPYSANTITRDGARTCTDCHLNMGGTNEAITQYNTTGLIRFTEWDEPTKVLSWIHGIVPIPDDYQSTLRMDFLTYTGDPSTPPNPDPTPWTSINKDVWDGSQMFFATPLTRDQMDALGFVFRPDVNRDGVVNVLDLLDVLTAWGPCSGCNEDINGDGVVDVLDLLDVLINWT